MTHIRKYLSELDSVQHQFNKIVLDKLEKKRLGIGEERRHVTFSTQARRSFHQSSAESVVGEMYQEPMTKAVKTAPVTNTPLRTTPPALQEPAYEIETISPTTGASSIDYDSIINDTTAYPIEEIDENMRSESILESINNQNQSINLDQINTGIEYNQNTTFTGE